MGGGMTGFWLEGRAGLELGSSAVSPQGVKAEPVLRACVVQRTPGAPAVSSARRCLTKSCANPGDPSSPVREGIRASWQ